MLIAYIREKILLNNNQQHSENYNQIFEHGWELIKKGRVKRPFFIIRQLGSFFRLSQAIYHQPKSNFIDGITNIVNDVHV